MLLLKYFTNLFVLLSISCIFSTHSAPENQSNVQNNNKKYLIFLAALVVVMLICAILYYMRNSNVKTKSVAAPSKVTSTTIEPPKPVALSQQQETAAERAARKKLERQELQAKQIKCNQQNELMTTKWNAAEEATEALTGAKDCSLPTFEATHLRPATMHGLNLEEEKLSAKYHEIVELEKSLHPTQRIKGNIDNKYRRNIPIYKNLITAISDFETLCKSQLQTVDTAIKNTVANDTLLGPYNDLKSRLNDRLLQFQPYFQFTRLSLYSMQIALSQYLKSQELDNIKMKLEATYN